ncbi:MAG: hypothetical protein ACI9P5_004138, partial [Saprospiraceae bacterium]
KEMNAGSGERQRKFKSHCTVFTRKYSKNE